MKLGRGGIGTRSWELIIAVVEPVYLGGIAKSAVNILSASESCFVHGE
jgi:hypothetical protein